MKSIHNHLYRHFTLWAVVLTLSLAGAAPLHAFGLDALKGAAQGAAQEAVQGQTPQVQVPATPSFKDMAFNAVKQMVQQKLQATGLPFSGEDVSTIVTQVQSMASAGKLDMSNGSQLTATVAQLVMKWVQGR
ncbi:MAG: hypothetical protein HQL53_13055 [Magnetococcales bacterium]|nr:hypothetical protein [Magnetococcales bacterium]